MIATALLWLRMSGYQVLVSLLSPFVYLTDMCLWGRHSWRFSTMKNPGCYIRIIYVQKRRDQGTLVGNYSILDASGQKCKKNPKTKSKTRLRLVQFASWTPEPPESTGLEPTSVGIPALIRGESDQLNTPCLKFVVDSIYSWLCPTTTPW